MADVLAEATVVVGGKVDPSIGADVAKSFDRVDDALDDAAAAFRKLDDAIQDARATSTRAFGELSESSNLARDGFGDLSTAAGAVGSGLAATGLISEDTAGKLQSAGDALGGVEGAFTAVKGASSLAGSAITTYGSKLAKLPGVQQAVALGQKAINLAMKANPIGLIITALTLLAAGLVLAYKKSETFRNIVNKAFDGVKKAAQAVFGFITGYIRAQITIWSTIFNGVKKVLGGIWNGVSAAASKAFSGLKAVLRPIVSIINSMIRGFNKVSALAGIPAIPQIPKFASGVRNFRGGLAVVGEQGPEVVALPKGSDVYSNRDSQQFGAANYNTFVFNGPTSFAGARREGDWANKYGTRFGTATRPAAV